VITSFIRTMSHAADVVIYTAWPYTRRSYSLHGAQVHTLSDGEPRGLGRVALWGEYRRRIRADHAERPFDLLHGFWATEPGYLATRIATGLGIPSVVSLAGGELAALRAVRYGAQLHPWRRHMVAHALRRATVITAGSEWLAAMVPPALRPKLEVIPLGVDTAMFTPAPERPGTTLLAAGSLIALKDYPTLLEAIRIAHDRIPGLRLDIAGDGVERAALEELTGRLGLRDVVRFIGNIPYDRMPGIFASHDLLVHASLHEAQGMVLLEALAAGMPVVASDVGIARSVPGDLLYRFSPGDAAAMAEAIIRSLGDRTHASMAARCGPELIGESYSLEIVRDRFLDLYTKIAAKEK
jgi:glycosyltransferase involved in cell wall biosynthesis